MAIITHNPLKDGYDFFITDHWNKEYHFKILTFEVPSGMLSIAIETCEETEIYYPRKIEVLSDFYADIEHAELLLKAKIKKAINLKSLKLSDNNFEIVGNTLRGEILIEHDCNAMNETIFGVDGYKISIQQLCNMLAPCTSFNFKLEIIDPSDEII
jgi:hypothetical protein